jgi:hypothetical protein
LRANDGLTIELSVVKREMSEEIEQYQTTSEIGPDDEREQVSGVVS